jgi:hypothetical protein
VKLWLVQIVLNYMDHGKSLTGQQVENTVDFTIFTLLNSSLSPLLFLCSQHLSWNSYCLWARIIGMPPFLVGCPLFPVLLLQLRIPVTDILKKNGKNERFILFLNFRKVFQLSSLTTMWAEFIIYSPYCVDKSFCVDFWEFLSWRDNEFHQMLSAHLLK